MKKQINKWIGLLTGVMLLTSLNSCLKDKGYKLETDFSGLQDHVVLLNAGLGGIGASNVGFTTDTAIVIIRANLTSVNPPTAPVVVTIAVDTTQIAAYNASHSTAFVAVPDSAFTLTTTTLTIPAGQQYANTTISFYKSKLDPSVSYMLPVSIKDASGKALSSNENTRFFNIIGNPIAGLYEQYWSRWNASDSSSGAAGALYYNSDVGTAVFAAKTSTEIAVESQGTGETDIIDFTNTAGVLSNFTVSFPPGEAATLVLNSISTPVLEFADPVKGIYTISFTYVNSAGASRTVRNIYVKQ